MDEKTKEIIASKPQLKFYKECYARYGFEVKEEYRNKHHLHYTLLLQAPEKISDDQKEQLRKMEEKLRIIEVIDQKKRRFFTLFFNLMVHAVLFCLQSILLSWMGLYKAHPFGMLRAGVFILQIILIVAFCFKLWEIFNWNVTQKRLKEEILFTKMDKQIQGPDNKIVSVLFTRGSGVVPTLLYWMTGRQYTHASIGRGTQTECFYSFDFRGFKMEHPSHRRLKNGKKNSLCYQFYISDSDDKKLQEVIETYNKEKEQFHYSYLGAIFCVLRIYFPLGDKKHYFCSEFVSEQLKNMESFRLKKSSKMYFPNNLAKALILQKNLYKVLVNEV